jgi:hypothetical protein
MAVTPAREAVDDARAAKLGSISCPTRGEQETGSDVADQTGMALRKCRGVGRKPRWE